MLRSATDGTRNTTLFRASAIFGVHVADGAVDPQLAKDLLTEAALEIGLEDSETAKPLSYVIEGDRSNVVNLFSHRRYRLGENLVPSFRRACDRGGPR
jgi:hypothetical protein